MNQLDHKICLFKCGLLPVQSETSENISEVPIIFHDRRTCVTSTGNKHGRWVKDGLSEQNSYSRWAPSVDGTAE